VTDWNRDLIQYRIERAYETLEDAQILKKSRRWKAFVNRLYYACYYAVSGLLLQKDLFSSKHTGIRSFFNLHFVKSGKVPKDYAKTFNDLFERRQESDYVDFVRFTESQVRPWIEKTEKFVAFIDDLIQRERK
jgi:uncharacterized protein (UPF0332 family)